MIEAQPSNDDKTIAILTHVSGILFGFIVPLIVWLVSRESKPWLAEESKEALNFQITVAIGYIVSTALIVVLVGAFTALAVWAINLVFCIIAAVKTSQGEQYRYPLTLRLIK
ncbi:MAG: DUF4870 domain-containing protein [bacterium]|nr:DUF4870 domain-containing protein [bacterium]